MHGDTVDGHERRAFYDFTISAPKTFSVAAVTGGLEEARDWHRAAVVKAVAEMEQWTAYRTNRGGNIELHPSGNFCAAIMPMTRTGIWNPSCTITLSFST